MPVKRKDNKGRNLRNGEAQLPDGRYQFRYTDEAGQRRTVYSWKLVETDKVKAGQRDQESLREKEKRILKDIDDHIRTKSAEEITVKDMFEQFLNIRIDLRGATRKCYRDLFNAHVSEPIGNRTIGSIKPSNIQKMYQQAVTEHGVTPSTVQKMHSVVYQIFEMAVMDNIIRTNPAANAFKYFLETVLGSERLLPLHGTMSISILESYPSTRQWLINRVKTDDMITGLPLRKLRQEFEKFLCWTR